jgi:hypothetical protein
VRLIQPNDGMRERFARMLTKEARKAIPDLEPFSTDEVEVVPIQMGPTTIVFHLTVQTPRVRFYVRATGSYDMDIIELVFYQFENSTIAIVPEEES